MELELLHNLKSNSKTMLHGKEIFHSKKIAAIIPSYKPQPITLELIEYLLANYKGIEIVMVDDSTPKDSPAYNVCKRIENRAKEESRLTYLRTPENKLKAGALNFALSYLWSQKVKPQVVFTLDDDIKVTTTTLYDMVGELYSQKKMGAVCSQTHVINKNDNLLTRLQAMEYHNFTITKIADNGFLLGPLVMQGMLTAFRMQAIQQVKGFTSGHLIEDYEITVRMKKKGWKVAIAKNAEAWADAPLDFPTLWKQRVRWTYGGLEVLKEFGKDFRVVFQDVLGHSMFLILLSLVVLSFVFTEDNQPASWLPYAALGIAAVQFVFSTVFNIILLKTYKESDWKDWVIKLSIVPELLYCNALSLVLLGSYLYFVYNHTVGSIARRFTFLKGFYNFGLKGFKKIGYSFVWASKGQ
jgi:cellulose synthase/poly-beta-1,6-N-acetylglucosamine synthase-like glycosyltransferase